MALDQSALLDLLGGLTLTDVTDRVHRRGFVGAPLFAAAFRVRTLAADSCAEGSRSAGPPHRARPAD